MIPSPIEEIKNRLDIVQVVGEYLKLQKAGANFRALCPFHAEKSPSFFVSPARQMWHCFGCSVGGDVFKFVMQIEGIEFGDALRLLSQKAGVELPQWDPSYAKLRSERKQLQEIMELATLFFEKQFSGSKIGQEARTYLEKRGVKQESLNQWRIGYAPDTERSLLDFLLQKGFQEGEIGRTGLLVKTEDKTFDRFRSRIIFPVFDLQSQVIGFGGRIFGKEGKGLAKYINTPSTPLYDKSRVLYGLDKGKLEMRKQDACMLVEGYMDAILAFQAGTGNVVATSGTALTSFHLQVLKRYTENLLFAFDMDVAGDSATKRGIDLALSQGFNLKVVLMPQGKDPADLASQNPELWQETCKKAVSIFDYYFSSAFSRFDKKSAEGKKQAAKVLLPFVKKIPNAIEQTHWIQRLGEELSVGEEAIREELKKIGEEPDRKKEQEPQASFPKTRRQLLEEEILALIFRNPKNLEVLKDHHREQMSLATQEIILGITKNPTLEFSAFQTIFPAKTIEFLKYLALRAEVEEEGDREQEFRLSLKALELLSLKEKLDAIAKEIKEAEQQKDQEKVALLLKEFHELTKALVSP